MPWDFEAWGNTTLCIYLSEHQDLPEEPSCAVLWRCRPQRDWWNVRKNNFQNTAKEPEKKTTTTVRSRPWKPSRIHWTFFYFLPLTAVHCVEMRNEDLLGFGIWLWNYLLPLEGNVAFISGSNLKPDHLPKFYGTQWSWLRFGLLGCGGVCVFYDSAELYLII